MYTRSHMPWMQFAYANIIIYHGHSTPSSIGKVLHEMAHIHHGIQDNQPGGSALNSLTNAHCTQQIRLFSRFAHIQRCMCLFFALVGLSFLLKWANGKNGRIIFVSVFERCSASSFTFPNQFIRCKHQQVIFCLLSITIIIILLRNCNRVYAFFSHSLSQCVFTLAHVLIGFYSGSLLHRAHMLTHEVQFFVVFFSVSSFAWKLFMVGMAIAKSVADSATNIRLRQIL